MVDGLMYYARIYVSKRNSTIMCNNDEGSSQNRSNWSDEFYILTDAGEFKFVRFLKEKCEKLLIS